MTTRKSGRTNNNYKILIMMGIVLILVIAGFMLFRKENAGLLTEEQAKLALLQEYPGNVQSLNLKSGKYVAELQTLQGTYELKLDGETGEIVSIVLLKPAALPAVTSTPTPAPVRTPGPAAGSSAVPSPGASLSPSASPSSSPQRVVSEQEAVRLALQEVPGEADDVDTGIDEWGAFYLVEVNTADGREAVVQVDAISGNIRSVAWEEPDDDS